METKHEINSIKYKDILKKQDITMNAYVTELHDANVKKTFFKKLKYCSQIAYKEK